MDVQPHLHSSQASNRRTYITPRPAQAEMESFWRDFESRTPGKVHRVLPQNPYATSKSNSEQKGPVPGHLAFSSYDKAKKHCLEAVTKIKAECKRCNLRYRDLHFDIEWDLKTRAVHDCLVGLKTSGWTLEELEDPPRSVKRVNQIFDKPKFYVDGPSPTDIRQGTNEDCWFLAALGALGNREGLIQKVCVAQEEEVGVYGFVFHRDGEWIYTIIDDKLYLSHTDWDESRYEKQEWSRLRHRKDAEGEYQKAFQSGSHALHFAQCTHKDETWLPLLEKAYAKAHGDYDSIDNGFTGEAIEDLTGGVTTELFTSDILDPDEFWKNELMRCNKEFLFGCATGRFDDWAGGAVSADRKGIQPKHAYSIMAAEEVMVTEYKIDDKGNRRAVQVEKRLLKIRNPWGKTEWEGPWSDGSEEWTEELKQKLGHTFGNDGLFWISYEDWRKKYHFLDRTRLFDDKKWNLTQQWTTLQLPWSADYHETKFNFELTEKQFVVVVLSQLDDRYWREFKDQYTFSLHFRINKAGHDDYIVRSHGNYCMSRSVSTEYELDAGSYDVRMKITAVRDTERPSILEVVKENVDMRQEKLTRVAMSYDMAHAKGLIVETEEEKIRKAAQARETVRNKARYLRHRKMKTLLKDHERRHRLELEFERLRMDLDQRNLASDTRRTPESPLHFMSDHLTSSINQTTAYSEPISDDDEKIEEESEDIDNGFEIGSFGHHPGQAVHSTDPVRHTDQMSVPRISLPPRPGSSHSNVSIDTALDGSIIEQAEAELLRERLGQINGAYCDGMSTDSVDSRFASDPWNAVCVVGLRVFTAGAAATIRVVRSEDQPGAQGTTPGRTGLRQGGEPAPLDVDDPMRPMSDGITVTSARSQSHPGTSVFDYYDGRRQKVAFKPRQSNLGPNRQSNRDDAPRNPRNAIGLSDMGSRRQVESIQDPRGSGNAYAKQKAALNREAAEEAENSESTRDIPGKQRVEYSTQAETSKTARYVPSKQRRRG